MKEKIAKIIQDGVCSGDSSWDEITIEILKAMREPTEKMINEPKARCYNSGQFVDQEVRRIYTAMIDSIIND